VHLLRRGSFQVKKEGKNLFREEDSPETMDLYHRRLLSLLCGRFVIMTRPGATHAERLETSHGIPPGSNPLLASGDIGTISANVHEI
jgi:hypothetical protein